ncbi:VCBS domain-containing protein [Cloacibacillus sp.]
MAKQIVTKAEGEVYRLEADGSKIKLQTGDLVEAGTRIITETGASVRFEDENGVPIELGENSGTVLFSDVLIEPGNTLFTMEPGNAAAEEAAAEEPQDSEAELPLPSDDNSGTISEMHSFVETPRVEYGGDINLSYARDVNVTEQIEGRASLNPRIKYDYNASIVDEVKSYEDPRFPFDGGGHGEESRFEPVRPAAETIPMPETTGTAAVTDEDVSVVIDPLENFVIPSGMQLTVTGASAMYGTVQIIDGKITYQPNADYHGGDKITVTVTDQTGRTYESEVDVTVNSVADTVDDTDSVREHASVDTDVLANDTFADLPGAKVTGVTQGQYGEVTINEDGTVKYTPKTDWLSEGETLTDTYEYTVTTAAGNTETATVTITITGTNDEPALADDVRYVTEDASDINTELPHGSSFDNDDTSKVTGNLLDNDSDPDQNDTLTVTKIEFSDGTTVNAGETINGKYGNLTVNSDGTYTYTLNSGTDGDKANNVQRLMADEKVTDEFTVSVTDGSVTKTETVTIHITGTNDAPVITMEAGDSDGHGFTEGDTLSQSGTLTVTDIDVKDTVGTEKEDSLTIGGDYDESSLPVGLTVDDLKNMLTIENGSIDGSSMDGKIDWHFNAGGGDKFDFLADGETLTLTYTVKSTDGSGAEATHDITITITGTNDAPVISLGDGDSAEGGVRETDSGSLTASDTLTVTDADISDTVSTSVALKSVEGSGSIPSDQELLGMFSAETSGLTNTTTEGKITWTFNTGDKTFDYLAVGEEVKLTYTIKVDDGHGGTFAQDVVVTVTGSNDRPEISVVSGSGDSDSISFGENDAAIADGTAGGTLTLTDVDVRDEVGVTVDGVRIDGSAENAYKGELPTGLLEALKDMLSVATGNILSNTDTSKQFDWKFNAGANDKFDFLADGETLTLKYTVKADDQNGIAGDTSDPYNEGSTGTHEITITITGMNDAPVISLGADDAAEGGVTETDASHLTVSDTLTVTDADISDTVSTSVTGVKVSGSGNIAGNIPSDQELLGMFSTKIDGLTNTTTEGKITWTFDSGDKTFDYLSVGETVELTYTVKVDDGHGGTVTRDVVVTVHGSNDTPEISVGAGDSTGKELTENGAGLTESGTLTLTDIDLTDNVGSFVTKVEVEGSGAGLQGQPSLDDLLKMLSTAGNELDGSHTNGKIEWTFDSNGTSFDYLGDGDELVLKYTVQAKDDNDITDSAHGEISASNEQVITIVIKGTNSAPILVDDTNSVTEDNGLIDGHQPVVTTTEKNLFDNDSDPDHDGKAHWKITNAKESTSGSDTEVSDGVTTDIVGKYGTLHLNSDGTYTYTLNNNSDEIQRLGHDAQVTDKFTVTVKDGELGGTQELTINIHGTNDRPEITAAGSDSNGASVNESEIVPSANAPEASGTLTISDVDNGDKVTVTKLGMDEANFKIEGEQAGLISTREELYNMLSLLNTEFTTSDGTHAHQFTWTFESGDERFNYLNDGQTLTLKYRIQAADDSGAGNKTSNDEWITITINGSSQDGNPAHDTGIVREDGVLNVSDHSGAINQNNQNLLYNDDSDGHIVSFKIDGDSSVYYTGTNVNIVVNGNVIGTLNISANGNYTFKPAGNYSGEVPTITYTNSYGKEADLQITITPVADAPRWETISAGGSEDEQIDLNLKLPEITDNVDLNGNAAGDHPERLGYITIGIPDGATIYNGGSALTSVNGKITVVIVDGAGNLDTGLHYTGLDINGSNVVWLTQAEFEALTTKQAADSGENIKIDLSVTSYETDDNGNPLTDADGKYISAESSTTVDVDVQAVTDATPDVKILGKDTSDNLSKMDLEAAISGGNITLDGSGGTVPGGVTITEESGVPHITIAEDSGTLKLDSTFITAKLESASDTDGSEHYSITISGLEAGTKVNGVTAGVDGTVTLKEGTINSGTDINNILEGLEITPPENYSGTMTPTVTVTTWDTDGDSSGMIAQNTDTINLPAISVTPVVDGVDTIAVKQAVGDEDTYIDLNIKPSSQDPSETFNVRISDIPKGATIKYGDSEYKCDEYGNLVHVGGPNDPSSIELNGSTIVIKDFDTSKLSILPPKDSNVDFVLKVDAQSVESDGQVSDWADSPTIDLDVTVHSVADPVTIETNHEHLTYTELQAEGQEIKLSSLIIKTADSSDGSEQVTLTVTGLAPEFTLEGAAVEYKGGEGVNRVWLVTMDKNDISNTDAYIKTPDNFSGEIKFSAQATNTDTCTDGISDSNSCTSEVTDVTITVTPTPEATVNMSAIAAEDELTQLSFAIEHQNGDNDEVLDAIYIKASDADGSGGKYFTIVYSEDGTTVQSLQDAGIEKVNINGVDYYKITSADGRDVDHIYVKGDDNYSGKGDDNSFDFKYEITDKEYTGEGTHTTSDPVTELTDGEYHVTFSPVTDATTMVETPVIGGIDDGGLTVEGTTVTVNSTHDGTDNDFSVKVTVNAPDDTDGSEHLVSLIVDGVPDGVKVDGAVYLGDSEATPGAGRWLVTISGEAFGSTSSIDQTIHFTVDRGNPNIWALNGQGAQKITITAVSQDQIDGMTGEETESSTSAEFEIKINFTGEGEATDIPAPGMTITANGGTVEDSESCTLADFFNAKYGDLTGPEYQGQSEFHFSITIKGFPEGATITGDAVVGKGVTISAENGSVTISGFGNNAAIESILQNVKVTLPENYNNNSDGDPNGMKLDVTWKTEGWDLNKSDGAPVPATGDTAIDAIVTPVTDPMEITITSDNATINENQSGETAGINFTIHVGNGGDGEYGQILNGGRLYVKLTDGSGDAHGTVTYGGNTYTLSDVSGVNGIADGKYYVIENVKMGESLDLTYTPDTFYSGNVTVTAQLTSQETGAGNIATSEGSLGLTVNPVNTEYNFEVNNASTMENGEAYLTFAQLGEFDSDGSEVVHCAYISGFDAAHGDDFIVKYILDGKEMTASKVAAGVDSDGNTLYQWVLSVDENGHLPTDVRIIGLNHYNGTLHLTATVVTGETALSAGLSNSVDFDVTFEPTADGFTSFMPTLTFGNSGEYLDLNLNAMVTDTTVNNTVETATVTLKGLGDGASFFIEDGGEYKAVTTTYDAATDTYTISGIALDKINDVKILTPNTGSHSVTVDAWTEVEGSESAHITDDGKFGSSFDIRVSEASPTDESDMLIYNGGGSYDGKGGEDILFMANFRDAASANKNAIDFSDKSIDIKNIEVIDMSDGDHLLANISADTVKSVTDDRNVLLIKGEDGDKIILSEGWKSSGNTAEGYRVYTNNGATINVAGDVNVTIGSGNGIDTASLMMAMAFAPLSYEAPVMPDSITDYGDSSMYDGIHGSAPLSIGTEGTLDFSAVSGSMLDSIDMTNDTAQSLFNVDPFGVYNITGGSHELTITGTSIDDVSVADAADVPWGAPELSADGSHYTYTATGDFDHNAATPDETVTLNVAREIYDDTLAYDAHALNDGGLGDDTLTFGHENSVIDFNDGAASQIANIERFDLGDGDHSLENITAKDVFDMTDGRNTLTINGDNADHVSLSDVLNDSSDGMWEASPIHSVENGVSYNVYTGSFEGHTVILKVEEDIIQQLTGISRA